MSIKESAREEEPWKNETAANAEEKLGIGKPIEFAQEEKHSFHEWLQLSALSPIVRHKPEEKPETDIEKEKKLQIIDRFIETNPKIIPNKNTPQPPAATEKSHESPSLMTETLARVYLEQKKYTKAIQAYEILILKYPEKSVFFADRISDIKILQQNNN